MRKVLEKLSDSQFVVIRGMGCNYVRAQASELASSMRLQLMGHECAADYLTDSVELHDLYRLDAVTLGAKVILVQPAKQYEWREVSITNAANSVHLQEECAILVLRISRVAQVISPLLSTSLGIASLLVPQGLEHSI